MVFTVNSETIENEHVQITPNDQGQLEITDKNTTRTLTLRADGTIDDHTHEGDTLGGPEAAQRVKAIFADQGHIGTSLANRPLISNTDRYVKIDPINGDDTNLGSDTDPLATITEALRRCPIFLRHRFVIYLVPGLYDEDLEIRNVICTGRGKGGDGGNPPADNRHENTPPKNNLEIRGSPDLGNPATWHDYEVGSLQMSGCLGAQSPTIMGVRFLRDSPYSEGLNSGLESDEWAAVSCHNGGSYQVRNCSFASNITTCVKAYGSMVESRQLEVDDGVYRAGFAKHHGALQIRNVSGGGPSTDEGFYATTSGRVIIDEDSGLTANSLYQTGQGAMLRHITDQWVMFDEGGRIKDLSSIGLDDGFSIELFESIMDVKDKDGAQALRLLSTVDNERLSTDFKVRVGRFSGTPPTVANGDMWYDDGTTGNPPGYYGHEEGVTKKFDMTEQI